MSNFCFFTDADTTGVLNPQGSSSAFGVVSESEFRVTSLHTANPASAPRVIAITDGQIAVQQDSGNSNVLNLILKPIDQPGVGNRINFVAIKYFIYKGVLKDSLISGSSVAAETSNQLTSRAKKAQDSMNRAAEVLLEEPANSISFTPSIKLLGYDITGNDDESLDKLFYKEDNSLFNPLTVSCGDYIGDFDPNQFGIEIVLDEVRTKANFILTKNVETKLQAPLPSVDNASTQFKRRHQKEAAISFMDPCAFFGSFFQHGGSLGLPIKLRYRLAADDVIDVAQETKDSDLHKANGNDIYDKLLVHFANKNSVYIDLRNELNTSINFYQNYGNIVKLTIPLADAAVDDPVIDRDYYVANSGWPLLVLRPDASDIAGLGIVDSDVVSLGIALPNPPAADDFPENVSPLIYVSQGYVKNIKRSKVLRGEKRYILLPISDGYTASFEIALANISGQSTFTPVSQYIRIKYLRLVLEGASSGIVPRASNYLDLLFLPLAMKIPFLVTANSKSRVYQEDTFLGMSAISGCDAVGSVGIAEDAHNVTLFAYAGDKLRTKGTTRLATISLHSEISTSVHYLDSVKDRYKRDTLVQGQIALQPPPNASYLRFVDNTPAVVSNMVDARLRDEFIAILIKKETFATLDQVRQSQGFSSEYDVFFRFSNATDGVDSAGVPFTSLDLVLEGYVDDGTSIYLQNSNLIAKVYTLIR